jgi:hypothetical protein
MDKIATPQDLQAELRSILAYVSSDAEKPSRQVLARRLRGLAGRVASGGKGLTRDMNEAKSTWADYYQAIIVVMENNTKLQREFKGHPDSDTVNLIDRKLRELVKYISRVQLLQDEVSRLVDNFAAGQ